VGKTGIDAEGGAMPTWVWVICIGVVWIGFMFVIAGLLDGAKPGH
jgi:hypothetical protein